MREQLERRLQQLKDEYAQGEKTLEDLQTKTVNVQRVMLRLSGAIQVLEEELAAEDAPQSTNNAQNGASNIHNGAESSVSVLTADFAALPVENAGHAR